MLTVKSQKICPLLPPESSEVSFAVSEESHFAVFSCQASQPKSAFTVQVLQNILTDVFNQALAFDNDQAVLPVLEEALKECREALFKLEAGAKFSAAAVLFKDDFVYVSIYGNAKALYLDGTQMVYVDMDKEGYFASGTQKIDDERVMVLCTQEFFKKYPPKSLVSLDKPILAQDLDKLSSAIILKVDKYDKNVAAGPSGKKEHIDNGKNKGPEKEEKDQEWENQIKLPDKSNGIGISAVGTKPPKATSGVVKSSAKFLSATSRFDQFQSRKFFKPGAILFGGLVLLLCSFFVFKLVYQVSGQLSPARGKSSGQQTGNKPSENNNKGKDATNDQNQESRDQQIKSELTKKLDEANKVKRVQPQVFYDISITDAKTNPSELAQGKNFLAVSDSTQGKIYISTKDVTKFEELPQLFPGVRNLQFDGDTLVFTDNEGVKFYAIPTKSVNKSYLADKSYGFLGPSNEYLGYTYAVTGDKLVKFTKAGMALAGVLWAQKEEFKNAVSMDIDGSIYVLFNDGSLEKYTAGVKDDFAVIGLDKPVQKPLKVVADANFKQIYMADGEEGRILAFDGDGVLEFQLKPELGSEWTALKSFDIAPDEETFYVLSGAKVFEFKL